tara:strand:+ start:133812 stop:134009 length:198 start_codon:yes stop_codon:yes gene_type:complete
MYFSTLQAALVMDGHGAFVWSAYLITLLVLVAMLVMPLRRRRRHLALLRAQVKRNAAEAKAAKEQ